jgi:hypothetical protein
MPTHRYYVELERQLFAELRVVRERARVHKLTIRTEGKDTQPKTFVLSRRMPSVKPRQIHRTMVAGRSSGGKLRIGHLSGRSRAQENARRCGRASLWRRKQGTVAARTGRDHRLTVWPEDRQSRAGSDPPLRRDNA